MQLANGTSMKVAPIHAAILWMTQPAFSLRQFYTFVKISGQMLKIVAPSPKLACNLLTWAIQLLCVTPLSLMVSTRLEAIPRHRNPWNSHDLS
ncbi:hypothetical protein ASE04_09110 [Rhizobium sp. Root708]|nr:hypothetical protein ASE04_09110 [Rhizobium sp. Root708]